MTSTPTPLYNFNFMYITTNRTVSVCVIIKCVCYNVLCELLPRPLLLNLLQEVWTHQLASLQHCGGDGTVVFNLEVHTFHWTVVECRGRVQELDDLHNRVQHAQARKNAWGRGLGVCGWCNQRTSPLPPRRPVPAAIVRTVLIPVSCRSRSRSALL